MVFKSSSSPRRQQSLAVGTGESGKVAAVTSSRYSGEAVAATRSGISGIRLTPTVDYHKQTLS